MRPYVLALPDWLPDALAARPIFSYGVMLGLSFFLGWGITAAAAKAVGYEPKRTSGALLSAIIVSLLAARAAWFLTDANATFSIPRFFNYASGGLVAYGGYIGGLFGAWAYLRLHRLDFWSWVDCIAPAMALGLGIGRIGCILYGCDYGVPADADTPMAVSYPRWDLASIQGFATRNPPALDAHIGHHGHAADAVTSLWVIPVQVYESLFAFALFGALTLLRRRKRFDGQTVLQFLAIYGVWRFFIEFLRGDLDRGVGWFGTPFSTSQLTSVAILVACVGLWRWLSARGTLFAVAFPTQASATAVQGPPRKASPSRKKNRKRR